MTCTTAAAAASTDVAAGRRAGRQRTAAAGPTLLHRTSSCAPCRDSMALNHSSSASSSSLLKHQSRRRQSAPVVQRAALDGAVPALGHLRAGLHPAVEPAEASHPLVCMGTRAGDGTGARMAVRGSAKGRPATAYTGTAVRWLCAAGFVPRGACPGPGAQSQLQQPGGQEAGQGPSRRPGAAGTAAGASGT